MQSQQETYNIHSRSIRARSGDGHADLNRNEKEHSTPSASRHSNAMVMHLNRSTNIDNTTENRVSIMETRSVDPLDLVEDRDGVGQSKSSLGLHMEGQLPLNVQSFGPWNGSFVWRIFSPNDERQNMDYRGHGGHLRQKGVAVNIFKPIKCQCWLRITKPFADCPAQLLEFMDNSESNIPPVIFDLSKVIKIMLGASTYTFSCLRKKLRQARTRIQMEVDHNARVKTNQNPKTPTQVCRKVNIFFPT